MNASANERHLLKTINLDFFQSVLSSE